MDLPGDQDWAKFVATAGQSYAITTSALGDASDTYLYLYGTDGQTLLASNDDTDTPEEGATWTLVHNIARAVEDERSVYLSHTIVQLFPVPYRTKNCVGLVAEFATSDTNGLVSRFHQLLEKYTLSKKTGMAVYTGFAVSEELLSYGRKVKKGEVEAGLLSSVRDPELRVVMDGRGIVGAVAAIPFFTKYEEALELCSGKI